MKIPSPSLPTYSFTSGWGNALTFTLTKILREIYYSIASIYDGYTSQVRVATGAYTCVPEDTTILCTTTLTVTLAPAAEFKNKRITVKLAASSGVVTVTPNGSETIDGATSQIINVGYTSIDLVSDGSNYWIV